MPCNHELDESARTTRFVPGKGLTGVCKLCGAKIIQTRRVQIKPTKPNEGKHHIRMKKKQRVPIMRELREAYAKKKQESGNE